MNQSVEDLIKNAELILIGIGDEMAPVLPDSIQEGELSSYQKSRYYQSIETDHPICCSYDRLAELIGRKDYFIVTLNTDDLIYRSNLNKERIVAPCGSMSKMQCKSHIVEAEEICRSVLSSGNEQLAVCPKCGQPLRFHTIDTEGYLEEGYLDQWNAYTRWLQLSLNRRICILELGVGFRFPQVIRFPFEKTAYYNKKATLIRVNSRFPQLPAEIAEKGISIAELPVDFLK